MKISCVSIIVRCCVTHDNISLCSKNKRNDTLSSSQICLMMLSSKLVAPAQSLVQTCVASLVFLNRSYNNFTKFSTSKLIFNITCVLIPLYFCQDTLDENQSQIKEASAAARSTGMIPGFSTTRFPAERPSVTGGISVILLSEVASLPPAYPT